jgi:S-adenosylmethionine:tRNA-ribosyltransferase-isomerase (queuine synthetase)
VVRLRTALPASEAIERHGHVPLPPYIARPDEPADAAVALDPDLRSCNDRSLF